MTKQGYNMAIKIPVSAQFDAADLKQQIQMVNDQIRVLASQVGQANKQKFEPINVKSKEDSGRLHQADAEAAESPDRTQADHGQDGQAQPIPYGRLEKDVWRSG
jgi:hypothetical protein